MSCSGGQDPLGLLRGSGGQEEDAAEGESRGMFKKRESKVEQMEISFSLEFPCPKNLMS